MRLSNSDDLSLSDGMEILRIPAHQLNSALAESTDRQPGAVEGLDQCFFRGFSRRIWKHNLRFFLKFLRNFLNYGRLSVKIIDNSKENYSLWTENFFLPAACYM